MPRHGVPFPEVIVAEDAILMSAITESRDITTSLLKDAELNISRQLATITANHVEVAVTQSAQLRKLLSQLQTTGDNLSALKEDEGKRYLLLLSCLQDIMACDINRHNEIGLAFIRLQQQLEKVDDPERQVKQLLVGLWRLLRKPIKFGK